MKFSKTRALALCLALLTLFTLAAPGAAASYALGTELHQVTTALGPGVTVTRQSLWSATYKDLRTEGYLTYTPTAGITPEVVCGDKLWDKATLTSFAQRLEADGRRVLGGTNGDYFVMSTGEALGTVVTGGVLRSGSPYYAAVGFRADGSVIMGMPKLTFWADFHGYHLLCGGGYNKTQRDGEGYAFYNGEFGRTAGRNTSGVDVILRPLEGDAQMTVGGSVTCEVVEVIPQAANTLIPEGCFVLGLGYQNGEFLVNELAALQPGEEVTLSVTAGDPVWEEAVSVVGAFETLVADGQVQSGLETSMAPRTAAGLREDGSLILYTIDGRQAGHSVGAGMDQVAKRLVELGCTQAVLFDGGGSTTLGTTDPIGNRFSVANRPSGGSQRGVSNALFFVSDLTPSGEAGSFHILPQDGILLSGARVDLTGWAVDTNGFPLYPMTGDVTYSVQGPGQVEGATLTAGTERGDVTVTALTSGGCEGTAGFTVVTDPSSVTLHREDTGAAVSNLTAAPGETVAFSARSVWYNLPVTGQDDCYIWSADPAVGTVDGAGTFTAGYEAGTGALTAQAGNRTGTVTVTVPTHMNALHTCEDLMGFISGTAKLSAATGEPYVKYGRQALRVTVPQEGGSFSVDLPVAAGEVYLGLWAYGDGAPVTLTALTRRADGEEAEVTVIDHETFTGWRAFFAPIAPDTAQVTGFTVLPGEGSGGVLYLDQFLSSNRPQADETAPAVALTLRGTALTATLSDDLDGRFEKSRVTVTVDGAPVDFALTGNTVTAALPEDGGLHRVRVTAADASGNLGTAAAQTGEAGESGFGDLPADHWAAGDVACLTGQGMIKGYETEEGLLYRPGQNMTRLEFAVLAARWLRLDPAAYEEVALPFVDLDQVADWALPELRAVYAHGFFTGAAEADGRYAKPNDPITRAEAMTLLGRTQAQGYGGTAEPFGDDADIPDWARGCLYALAARGVVSGSDGMVRPNDPITRAEVAKLLTNLW